MEKRRGLRTCVGQKIHRPGPKVWVEAAEARRGYLLPAEKPFSCVAFCFEPRAQLIVTKGSREPLRRLKELSRGMTRLEVDFRPL